MKEQLANELVIAITPYLTGLEIQDLKMRIDMVLGHYDITQAEHALTVYEGDINDLMLKRFLSAKIAKGCSKRTIQEYGKTIPRVLKEIGKPYQDVTADDVRLYLATRIHRDKVSKTTANNERRDLSAFYTWLQKEELLLKNPMNRVDKIKVTKMQKPAFTMMDLEKIRYACRSLRETAMVELMLSTWCRVSELVEMKISDVRGGVVTVHGKGDKYRDCYLNAKAILALHNYLNERKDSNPYIFPRGKYTCGNASKYMQGLTQKEAMNWFRNPELVDESQHMDKSSLEAIIRKIGKRAGVENCHPHRFRRTGATMALRSGMSLITVSKILGHEQIDTTQLYLDISDEELEQAHRKYVT